jgi:predicted short-subunit dehydrogenase-like oxidoreductase (DUF2520 family)
MAKAQAGDGARLAPMGVVGCGRLGASLAHALAAAGYRVVALAGRDPVPAQVLAAAIPDSRAVAPYVAVRAAELVLLVVPDDAVEELASALPWRPGQAVVHCAGALDLSPLAAAARAGAATGCLHPLQAFPEPGGLPERLRGIAFGVEVAEAGGSALGALLEALALDIGAACTLRLEGVDRALYHAAAVIASNDVVALAAAAGRAWALAGLPTEQAARALGPLLVGAAEAVAALPSGQPLAEALTGPLARGDVATVRRHLDALSAEPALAVLYRTLGRELLALGLAHPPAVADELHALLDRELAEGAP